GATDVPIDVADGGAANGIDLEIPARISQASSTRGFTKTGDGTLKLSPPQASTYTGPVRVFGGTVLLNSTDQTDDGSGRGNRIIGEGGGGPLADAVRDLRDGQIVETSGHFVTVNSSGLLDINGHAEAIFDLNVIGGRAEAGGGILEVQGTAHASAGGLL